MKRESERQRVCVCVWLFFFVSVCVANLSFDSCFYACGIYPLYAHSIIVCASCCIILGGFAVFRVALTDISVHTLAWRCTRGTDIAVKRCL